MDEATKKTIPFLAWWVAYAVVGALIFLLCGSLLRLTTLDDTSTIFLSMLMTMGGGWLGANAVQRRVARRLDASSRREPKFGPG
ncbi:hypothetical protein ACFUC1_09740 [Pedococcus sp. NPDC057267]|uniref:hypothetical protein n=1 Tax=Pedococcus sp. NPDC057267 TaxID=3346077 RepID=UPI0036324610